MLKVGDTIQCADEEDMLKAHNELAKEGIYTDWLDIAETGKIKWRLTVVGVRLNDKNE